MLPRNMVYDSLAPIKTGRPAEGLNRVWRREQQGA